MINPFEIFGIISLIGIIFWTIRTYREYSYDLIIIIEEFTNEMSKNFYPVLGFAGDTDE